MEHSLRFEELNLTKETVYIEMGYRAVSPDKKCSGFSRQPVPRCKQHSKTSFLLSNVRRVCKQGLYML